jgi:TPR repeat protein
MMKHVMVCLVVLVGCGKKKEQAGTETGSAAAKPAVGSAAPAEAPAAPPAATPAATATPPADLPPRNSPATAEVLAKFDAACDGGYGAACFDAGMRRAMGMGATKDRVAATTWLEKGCKLDDAESCGLLAGFVALGEEGVPQDKARAVELHGKACPKRAESCRLLAGYYGRGEVVTKDITKAMSLLDQACKGGDEKACKQADEHRAAGTDK